MPLKVIGIDHIQISVPRALEAQCLAFYRDVLGLKEIPKPAGLGGHGGAWFQAGHIQLHMGLDLELSPRSKRHICFLVADLNAAKAEMATGGILIEGEGQTDGLARLFIRDPAGNRIEIGQRV
jgi:catechol 2,3-dioxygenase-like lactoylglutathione lyase family enzyme